jgi:hypothetical protein
MLLEFLSYVLQSIYSDHTKPHIVILFDGLVHEKGD